jgi:hypothetical protein
MADRAHARQSKTMQGLVGERANGILKFDAAGNFSWQAIDPGIPWFASNNRHDGTREEYRAAAHGVMGCFGT